MFILQSGILQNVEMRQITVLLFSMKCHFRILQRTWGRAGGVPVIYPLAHLQSAAIKEY